MLEPQKLSESDIQSLAGRIAEELNEVYPHPQLCIRRVIELCGLEFADTVLGETLDIEARGGMMLPNKKRRRTPGGVYFYLIRQKVTPEQAEKIFAQEENPYWHPPGNTQVLPDGEARHVEVTVKGRVTDVQEDGESIVATIVHHMRTIPNLPLGVPEPLREPVTYRIYMSARQWKNTQQFLHVPEDELIVQGVFGRDPNGDGMAIFGMTVTTRQREWRLRKDAEAENPDAKHAPIQRPKPDRRPSRGNNQKFEKRPPQIEMPTAHADPLEQKLEELRSAASVYRQKIADIQAKPKEQQAGLPMTLRLLQNTEAQIRLLEQQKKDGK